MKRNIPIRVKSILLFMGVLIVSLIFFISESYSAGLKFSVKRKGKNYKLSFGNGDAGVGDVYEVYAATKRRKLKNLSKSGMDPIINAASNPLSGGRPNLTVTIPKIKGKKSLLGKRYVYFKARLSDVKNGVFLESKIKAKVLRRGRKKSSSTVKRKDVVSTIKASAAPQDTKSSLLPMRMYGDIWQATVMEDGRVAFMFGDGTGRDDCYPSWDGTLPGEGPLPHPYTEVTPGCYLLDPSSFESGDICGVFDCSQCYPTCDYTQTGFVILEGTLPNLECRSDNCLVAKHVPYGDRTESQTNRDKPSGLLAFPNNTLVAWMHNPPGDCKRGFVVFSTDNGANWDVVNRFEVLTDDPTASPWDETSNFCVMTPIQYGPGYSQNRDGFIYLLGTPDEVQNPMSVYMARVAVTDVFDYTKYTYYAGLGGSGTPVWSSAQADAVALANLVTGGPFGGVWNQARDEFNVLSSTVDTVGTGSVWRADNPWGPWTKVRDFSMGGASGVIAGDARYLYFTTSVAAQAYMYHLNRIKLD